MMDGQTSRRDHRRSVPGREHARRLVRGTVTPNQLTGPRSTVPTSSLAQFGLVLVLTFGGCSGPPATPPQVPPRGEVAAARVALDNLLDLMRQRLLVQHEVARVKWHARLPITDPKREQELLDRAEAQARDLGLEPGFAREFFRAQVQAGKLVQQADFDAWQRSGTTPPDGGPNLKALRLQIDSLNRKLLEALKDAGRHLQHEVGRRAVQDRADVVLRGDGITAAVCQAACAPLLRP